MSTEIVNIDQMLADAQNRVENLKKLKALQEEEALLTKELFSEKVIDKNTDTKPSVVSYADVTSKVSTKPAPAPASVPAPKTFGESSTEQKRQVFHSENSNFGDIFNVECVKKEKGNAVYHLTTTSGEEVVWTDETGTRNDFISCNWFTPFEPTKCFLTYTSGKLDIGYVFFFTGFM